MHQSILFAKTNRKEKIYKNKTEISSRNLIFDDGCHSGTGNCKCSNKYLASQGHHHLSKASKQHQDYRKVEEAEEVPVRLWGICAVCQQGKNRQVEASEENRQEDHQRNSKNFPGEHVQGESPCLQEWKEEIRKVGQVQQHENLRRNLPEQDYKPERLFR